MDTPEELAQMIDDGVKRSRKQVQQFDPYAEAREAERLKQEKIAMELEAEKEEKERLRLEKRKRKKEAKEKKKKREREEMLKNNPEKAASQPAPASSSSIPKKKKDTESSKTPAGETAKKVVVKEAGKTKKPKKSDRKRALKRAANEDPVIERLKQGWEIAQRNRATAAALRFGFDRFNKMRHESNLTSLPLQDLEIFVRSCKLLS